MDNSHLAAPIRNHLSATSRLVINSGLLQLHESHLDYGCGRGSDVERLIAAGYKSTGYDPYYFPQTATAADVVTMGYVLNVIEDPQLRRSALLHAWSLTRKRPIVSANVRGSGIQEIDLGRISDRGVWTKEYSHLELKAYIETVLGVRAEKLSKDKFLVSRDAPTVTVRSRSQVLELEKQLQNEGFIAPFHCVVKGYCTEFQIRTGMVDTKAIQNYDRWAGARRYYRLHSKNYNLPGAKGQMVKVIHLGHFGTEKFEWAIASIKRRNILARAKFHCKNLSFLNEFSGIKDFNFLINDCAGIQLDDEAMSRSGIRFAVPETAERSLK